MLPGIATEYQLLFFFVSRMGVLLLPGLPVHTTPRRLDGIQLPSQKFRICVDARVFVRLCGGLKRSLLIHVVAKKKKRRTISRRSSREASVFVCRLDEIFAHVSKGFFSTYPSLVLDIVGVIVLAAVVLHQ